MSQSNNTKAHRDHPDSDGFSSTIQMCKYCFDTIINELTRGHKRNTLFDMDLSVKSPLFVTWEMKKNGNYNLRGCIGTLAPQHIHSALGEYAKTSAFQDPRFDPISLSEVPSLRVSVSLLVRYEDCENCLDWTPGIHGVCINFTHSSQRYSATYLPEVAAEQGWSQLEAIKSLVKKSGFREQWTDEMIDKIICTRYQSSKQLLTYEAYTKMHGSTEVELDNRNTGQKSGRWFSSLT